MLEVNAWERAWIASLKSDDKPTLMKAWGDMVACYSPILLDYVVKKLRNYNLAHIQSEDILHTVCAEAQKKNKTIRAKDEIEMVYHLLLKMERMEIYKRLRDISRRPAEFPLEALDDSDNPFAATLAVAEPRDLENRLILLERMETIHDALERIQDPIHREVFLLWALSPREYTPKRLFEMFPGKFKNANHVSVTLTRIKKNIRDFLDNSGYSN